MIIMRKLLFISTIFILIVQIGYLKAQDLTEFELEKVIEIRERLFQEEFLQDDTVELSLQSVDAEPVIINSYYTNKSASFSTESSRDTDIHPNGSRFYILGRNSLNIQEYHLSTSWDIGTASYVRELNISNEMGSAAEADQAPHGLYIRKDDGQKMWVLNRTEIWEYTLSDPWNISSATQTGYKDLDDLVRGHGIDFKPDGSVLYIDDRAVGVVFQYFLSTSWDISTAFLDEGLDISNQQEEVRGIQLNQDGSRMYLNDTMRQEILEYHLSSPYNIRTASYIGSYSVRSQTSEPRAITFKPDFRTYYITSTNNERVYQYNILTPDPDESTLAANRSKVIADGTASSRITVTVRDDEGNRLQGIRVRLQSSSSSTFINSVNSTTNSNGQANFDVRNSEFETVTFTASAANVSINQTVSVRFVGVDADESTIISSRSKVISDGSATSRITVTARDEDGDVLEGVRISLNSNSSNVQISNVNRNTDSNGEARFDVRNSSAEAVTFSANGMGVTIDQTVTVRFVTLDPEISGISANREKILANGSATGTITVTARDEDGDELQDVEISLIPDSGSSFISEVQSITDSDGRALFQVSNDVSEIVTYSAQGLGTTLAETVSINFVTVNIALSSISVSPETIQADGQERSTITVTTRDDDGDLLPGAEVELIENGSSAVIETIQNITDSNAEAFFRVTSTTPSVYRFTIIAEGLELEQRAELNIVPIAPVALSASEVENRKFTANWEMVDGVDSYIIDVASDSSFSEFVTNYQNRDVGLQTSYLVEPVNPGTQFMYRIRAQADGLTSNNSEIITTFTYPDIPVATAATNRSALFFTAAWQEAEGAKQYRLDVARDSEFSDMIQGYENLNTGSSLDYTVDGLTPGTSYYYRVRAEAGPRLTDHSNTVETSTLTISSELSEVKSEQLRVLANGNQTNKLSVTLRSDEGNLLEGVPVEIMHESGSSDIEQVQAITDEDGVALFNVSSLTAGIVEYAVTAAGIPVGDISVEFLQDEGVLKLGDNYPNPFNRQTTIPLTVPRSMHVNLTIYNSLGAPVRTLIDENMEVGYFEVPFQSNELASGVYFYRIIADGEILTEKMVLVK